MKRIIFGILIVIVAALTAVFCLREFSIPNINFIADSYKSDTPHHLKVERLYAAEVDFEAYNKALEEIIQTSEYTEEELFAAAINAGNPEFFPNFNLGVYRREDKVHIDGFVDVGFAEGQTDNRFKISSISLESAVVSGDLTFETVNVNRPNGRQGNNSPLAKVNSEKVANADIKGATDFRIILNGSEGRVTLKFIYDIETDTFLPKLVLENQILVVHADITPGNGVNLEVKYEAETYSDLEDIEGG